jgi:hypothetical protein
LIASTTIRSTARAQVKDGVLCRDAADADHFYLIGEWADIESTGVSVSS